MKRWIFSFFIVLLLLLSATLVFASERYFPDEVIKASEYVVKIKITTFEKGRWRSSYNQGSGFFVAPNRILTASHIGGSLKELFEHVFSIRTVEVEGEDYLVVEVVGIDFSRELALLEIGEDFPSYVLEFAESEVGDEVYFVGFSGGKRVFSGKVGEINKDILSIILKEPKEKFTPSGKVLPGMSGGPILDRDGKVVGLIWGQWFPTDKIGATPIEEIKKFLKELKNDDK